MRKMYDVLFDKLLLPVTPSKIQLKVKNQNKTITLINEGEINILKQAGLTDISFQVLIPQVQYPFAKYSSGFQGAEFFLDAFEKLKTDRDGKGRLKPFQFIVSRVTPDGKSLFDNNIKVALEDWKIAEEYGNGFDITVDIKLKQYRPYSAKTIEIKTESSTAAITETRPAESAPKEKTYKTISGDSLWGIAQKMLGDGNRYSEIYSLNQSAIDEQNKGTGLPKHTIHPNQILHLPL